MSKGENVKFLDADDYCSPAMIEKQMARLLNDGTDDTVIFSPVRMFMKMVTGSILLEAWILITNRE